MEKTEPKMKILAVCSRGNCRSVSLRHLLIDRGYDVLACGIDVQDKKTLKMLYEWADKIIVLSSEFVAKVPKKYTDKSYLWNVGQDIWGQAGVPGLMGLCQYLINENEKELHETT